METTALIGFDTFSAALETTAADIQKLFEEAAYKTATYVRSIAIGKAPIRTGTLKRSIIADVIPEGAEVTVNEIYGTYVEFGTGLYDPRGAHRIYPKTGKVLAWSLGQGKMAFAASTKGMKAQPYFFSSVDEGQVFLNETMQSTLSMVVAQLAGDE